MQGQDGGRRFCCRELNENLSSFSLELALFKNVVIVPEKCFSEI